MTAGPGAFKDPRKATCLNAEDADRPLRSPVPREVLIRARADPLRADLRRRPGDPLRVQGLRPPDAGLEGIDEVRRAIGWVFMTAGDRMDERLDAWSGEIAAEMRRHGGGNLRLACDKLDAPGVAALGRHGIAAVEGGAVCETARAIKSADEIRLMRWTIRVCEAGMARIYEHSLPGVTEHELWAHLHFENARSGGDWLETKLLTCGPNTNPWHGECSDRTCRAGEMIAFDTDMIGPYGYCADLSRSWTCGYEPMTNRQRTLYAAAREQIGHNMALLAPGLDFAEFNDRSWRIPEQYLAGRYSLAVHGVGVADEWPVAPLHPDFDTGPGGAMSGRFEEGMVIRVESLVSEEDSESVKLETRVLIGPQGAERLDSFPWENA